MGGKCRLGHLQKHHRTRSLQLCTTAVLEITDTNLPWRWTWARRPSVTQKCCQAGWYIQARPMWHQKALSSPASQSIQQGCHRSRRGQHGAASKQPLVTHGRHTTSLKILHMTQSNEHQWIASLQQV